MTEAEIRERVRRYWETATPEQVASMIAAQRESFIRAMAPCEHGDPDWETCPHCIEAALAKPRVIPEQQP